MNKGAQLAIDCLLHITKGNFNSALASCRELLVVLETFERSC